MMSRQIHKNTCNYKIEFFCQLNAKRSKTFNNYDCILKLTSKLSEKGHPPERRTIELGSFSRYPLKMHMFSFAPD